MAISSNFCYPQLHINGLRQPNIYMDRDGNVFFGCINLHLNDLEVLTDAEIESCAGPEAVTWWASWKPVLMPLFRKMEAEMDTYWSSTPNNVIAQDVGQARGAVAYMFQKFDPINQVPGHTLAKKPPMQKQLDVPVQGQGGGA